jgi:hypothetical protein
VLQENFLLVDRVPLHQLVVLALHRLLHDFHRSESPSASRFGLPAMDDAHKKHLVVRFPSCYKCRKWQIEVSKCMDMDQLLHEGPTHQEHGRTNLDAEHP